MFSAIARADDPGIVVQPCEQWEPCRAFLLVFRWTAMANRLSSPRVLVNWMPVVVAPGKDELCVFEVVLFEDKA